MKRKSFFLSIGFFSLAFNSMSKSMDRPISLRNEPKKIIAFDLHEVVLDFSYRNFAKALWAFLMKDPLRNFLLINPLLCYRIYSLISCNNRTAEHIYDLLTMRYYPHLIFCKEEFLAMCNVYDVNKDMYTLIQELKSLGYHIAICSNIGEQAYEQFKRRYPDLFDACDIVVVSEASDRYIRKPHKIFFDKLKDRCMRAWNNHPHVIFFVDDKKDNVHAAESAGLLAHHFTGIHSLREYFNSHGLYRNT